MRHRFIAIVLLVALLYLALPMAAQAGVFEEPSGAPPAASRLADLWDRVAEWFGSLVVYIESGFHASQGAIVTGNG